MTGAVRLGKTGGMCTCEATKPIRFSTKSKSGASRLKSACLIYLTDKLSLHQIILAEQGGSRRCDTPRNACLLPLVIYLVIELASQLLGLLETHVGVLIAEIACPEKSQDVEQGLLVTFQKAIVVSFSITSMNFVSRLAR